MGTADWYLRAFSGRQLIGREASRVRKRGRDRGLSVVRSRHLELLLIYTLPSLLRFQIPGVSALVSLRACIADDVRRDRDRESRETEQGISSAAWNPAFGFQPR